MPKALFVAPSAYTLSGLATWLDFLLPGLAAKGWEVSLGLVSGPHHHQAGRYLAAHPTENVLMAHCATGTAEGRRRALDRILDQSRADVAVSVNIPDLLVAINDRRLKGQRAAHAVLSVHGIEAWLYADARRYRSMLDAVVCTNRLACELTGQLGGIAKERIHYAAYGVHRSDITPRSFEGAFRIVYSGRLEESQKRVGDLVGIVHGLAERGLPFHLDIAGDGPERAELEAALSSQHEEGRVTFHGQLDTQRLKQDLYAQADALLITSHWETGPIVAWEAMAQDVPVVSSRYVGSGLEGALRDGETALLFDTGDVAGAVDALSRLHGDKALQNRLIASGRRLVEERYSIDASVRAWDAALRSVLGRPQACGLQELPRAKASGRLDRWLGPRLAENLRGQLRGKPLQTPDPGGEWPHAHSHAASDERFWQVASAVDQALDEVRIGVG
ncbi:MAG: glycosyltransferase family 4 protein [Xanthomonadales bacterium]|nr:D-inositol-3-phosphate glycosyltransferase [Xanthomonadales bacterium]MCC6593171.1 glycosyltransferase family 4 protein [Xanthomonadales bacterium]MCE7930729.1 glycosyltransferase family 1 protein [Xanthomonadales bacterium PRO6]